MKNKYVILGAGITGLSAAAFLEEDYCILEKETVVGGYCKSIYKKGFVWDYAGHFFHFSDAENKKFFEKVFNKENIINKEKNTKVFYKNSYIDYPFQCNIHQLNKQEFIECLYDLFFKEEQYKKFKSFKEMLYCKFGKSIAEKFLIPYNEKLYACNLNMLDSNAMGRFFPYATVEDIVRNFKAESFSTYNNSFIYPQKGAQVIIDYLLNEINKENIKLNCKIQDIDIDNKKIYLENEVIEYEYLINTIPLPTFFKLTNIETEELSYNKVLVFNLGFDKPSKNSEHHWVYIPDKEYNFYRIGFYNNIIDTEKLSMYIEIGFDKNAEINMEEEKERVLVNLRKMGIIDEHKLIAYHEIIMDPAYVHISEKSETTKQKIFSNLEQRNIYFIGRYGQWTYCSMEDCFNQAKNLVRKIRK